ncbi:MAG: hypothetical protein K6G76_02490, partial [Lachnospiraceae bacterium]|nr:hypothetical protein [Lachnospiraceae bacterium]
MKYPVTSERYLEVVGMPTTLSYNTRPAMDSTSCLSMPCLTSMSGIRLCTHGIPTTSKYLSD